MFQVVHIVEEVNTGKVVEMKLCGKKHTKEINIGASNTIVNEGISKYCEM